MVIMRHETGGPNLFYGKEEIWSGLVARSLLYAEAE